MPGRKEAEAGEMLPVSLNYRAKLFPKPMEPEKRLSSRGRSHIPANTGSDLYKTKAELSVHTSSQRSGGGDKRIRTLSQAWVHMFAQSQCTDGGQKAELRGVYSPLHGVGPGIELRRSALAASAFTHSTISPALSPSLPPLGSKHKGADNVAVTARPLLAGATGRGAAGIRTGSVTPLPSKGLLSGPVITVMPSPGSPGLKLPKREVPGVPPPWPMASFPRLPAPWQ